MLGQYNLKQFTSWHFLIFLGVFFSYFLNAGFIYHNLAYLNLFFVIYAVTKSPYVRPNIISWEISSLALIPIFLILIHFFAVGNIYLIKPIRVLSMAVGLGVAARLCFELYPENNKQNIHEVTFWLIFVFVAVQGSAVFFFNHPYGTFKNPHYLAQCCLLLLPIAVYLFNKVNFNARYLLTIVIILLGTLLLHNPSRPAWIGLMIGASLILMHFRGRRRLIVLMSLISVPCVLYLMDVSNFGNKLYDLYSHLQTEERVAIWRDVWKMQESSDLKAWLIGHGLDTFYENFKPYSSYHLEKVDFNSPHNFILELLYISGILGLILVIIFFVILYGKLIQHYRATRDSFVLLLIVLLTSNLIFVSITLPFYTKYNLNVLAVVVALYFLIRSPRGISECKN